MEGRGWERKDGNGREGCEAGGLVRVREGAEVGERVGKKEGGLELDICPGAGSPGSLGSRVVSVLDSGAEGPGFKSQSRRCRVTVLPH